MNFWQNGGTILDDKRWLEKSGLKTWNGIFVSSTGRARTLKNTGHTAQTAHAGDTRNFISSMSKDEWSDRKMRFHLMNEWMNEWMNKFW